tara:strand:- start:1272 stop:2042 length:771 start_codon:yes stop_codon:yes gene_type:complete
MKNLVFQYYIPYESFDADMGGIRLPEWAHAGSRSAKAYADYCNAEYELSHDRFFDQIDPRLDSIKIVFDKKYDEYDYILSIDLDMLIHSGIGENIFEKQIQDVAMVHELGVHTGGPSGWLNRVMYQPLYKRGIIAYGKHLWGEEWMFPKSKLYPDEKFRYMNGGLQLWSKEGRLKARKHFTSVDNYILHTRYTEQMYINLQLSQPIFEVTELDTHWNRMPYQWRSGPDGKINHFLARTKFDMPRLEKTELSIWESS